MPTNSLENGLVRADQKKAVPWIIVAVCALIWTVYIVAFQPKNATYHTRRVLGAYASGNTAIIASYQIDKEAELAPLTRQQIQEINQRIVFPVLRKYKTSVPVALDGPDNGKLGTLQLRNRDGRSFDFGVQVYSHGGKFKIFVTQAILGAWLARYSLEHNVPLSQENVYKAVLEGVERDRANLESLGLKGIVSPDPITGTVAFRSFDEITMQQRQRLAQASR